MERTVLQYVRAAGRPTLRTAVQAAGRPALLSAVRAAGLWLRASAETRDRAGDLQIFSLTLSQLSYRGHVNLRPRVADVYVYTNSCMYI